MMGHFGWDPQSRPAGGTRQHRAFQLTGGIRKHRTRWDGRADVNRGPCKGVPIGVRDLKMTLGHNPIRIFAGHSGRAG